MCSPTAEVRPYADRFRVELGERGYKPSAAAGQLQLMAHLSRWLVEQDLAGVDLTPAVTEAFLRARRAAGYGQWLTTRGMAPLLRYLRDVGFAPAEVSIAPTSPEEVLLDCYRSYLVAERGLAASTVRNYLEVARLFVLHRQASGQPDLRQVTAAQVCEFVVTGCRDRSVGSGKLLVVGLRALLRYLHVAGVTESGLADVVPPAASWPNNSLPQPIDLRQALRLLHSCDRRTAVGRRDFAVLTMQLRLGLRAGEVAALDLGDVDWQHGEILVHGKGHRDERLPLPTDVGEALVGWLRRGRIPCGSTRLFTSLIAPRGGLTSKAVSAIVRRASARSGVAVTAHRLRHTAGTELLRSPVRQAA